MDYSAFKKMVLTEVNKRLEMNEYAYLHLAETEEDQDYLEINIKDRLLKCGSELEKLYQSYCSGEEIEKIVGKLLKAKERYKKMEGLEKLNDLKDYEASRADLFVRAVNANRNQKLLKEGIYYSIGDIAVVLYLKISENGDEICSTMVKSMYLNIWGKTKEEVLKTAAENTLEKDSPRMVDYLKLLYTGNGEEYNGESIEEFSRANWMDETGYCLTTAKKLNGATAVFCHGIAEQICRKIEARAIYIVPTSIHECMIHDAEIMGDEGGLIEILHATLEESTLPEEVLSRHIFKYTLEDNQIRMIPLKEEQNEGGKS